MTDIGDWDIDNRNRGGDLADGAGGGAPVINGGLLDPRTFPSPWPPAADQPQTAPPSPDQDVHAQVLQDILDAQAKLPPIGAQPADDAGSYDGRDLQRPSSAITGPLRTDVPDEVMQDILNAQAGLPPVRPHPETWSVNGQPYLAIAASSFDPSRSNGVTSMPMPADSAAAFAGMAQIEVPLGTAERGGYIAHDPSKVVVTYGIPGGSDTADTLQLGAPFGLPFIHGHIDRRPPDPSDRLGASEPPPGMVDKTDANGGYGDSQSLSLRQPVPTATVSNGQVGWHVLDNGQLKFLYPPGSMTPFQIRDIQANLNQEQKKFLTPRP